MTDSITPPVGGHTPGRAKAEGASPAGAGLSPTAEPVPVSSAVAASIPDAWLDHKSFKPNSYDGKPRHLPAEQKEALQEMADKIGAHIEWLSVERQVDLLAACMSVSPINCSWQQHSIAKLTVYHVQHRLAQAMSAGTAETAEQAQGEARQRGPQDAPEQGSKATGVHPHE